MLPHSEVELTRRKCFCLQEKEALPHLHGVRGKSQLLAAPWSLGYLHLPEPIHYLLVSASEFQPEAATLVIQTADKM